MIINPSHRARPLWYIAAALLPFVVAVLAFRTWPWSDLKVPIEAALDQDCDLRAGPCTSTLNDGRAVRLSIEPRSIPPLVPLLLKVDAIGFTAQTVSVDLNGVDMHMGYNQISLNQHPEGHFAGTGSLSVCIRKVMEWEALVTVETKDAQITAPFRFITVKDGLQP